MVQFIKLPLLAHSGCVVAVSPGDCNEDVDFASSIATSLLLCIKFVFYYFHASYK